MIRETLFIVFILLFIIFLVTLTSVGLFSILKSLQNKMLNLLIIGLGYIFITLGFIGNVFFGLGSIFEEIFVSMGFLFCALFTKLTFHRNRNNYSNLVLVIIIILSICMVIIEIVFLSYGINLITYYIEAFVDIIFTFLILGWLGISSYSAYKILKNYDIEPLIKFRYKIMAIVSFILSSHAVPQLLIPWNQSINLNLIDSDILIIVFIIIMIEAVIFSIGFFLAWMPPKWLEAHLNRNYKPIKEEELTEKELVSLIKNQLNKK